MMSEDLCNERHGYDTGIFDSMIRSLRGSGGSHPTESLDNFFTVVIIWFLFGVVAVLVIGMVLLVVLDKISGGEYDREDCLYDEEKQVPPLDAATVMT
ncbi:hypothetical protein HG537_0G03900 [Torulaspora globosa]|uniref:Uncharacterized protein n=1 Tax=Torulaspora globosa TaxID=48254 RepID=A0A7H9HZW2_9SACH|nr:hypothetical protein HG537_0G03900 [Torulaspora sp. CBS 2947]